MSHLSLALLGALDVTVDGQPVTGFVTDKVRALLVYLVMESDHAHRRDALAELLWPEQAAHVARNSLRQALATLRQAIGDRTADPPFLHITAETIQFNPSSDHRLDVAVFTTLLAGCEQHLHHRLEACTPCAMRRLEAVALYRRDFLEQFSVRDSRAFEEWALLKREGLQRRCFHALAALATYYERRGAYQAAERYAWRQVELAPWREEAHRQLMRVLAASGQHGAALRQYKACHRSLQEELGVEPAAETTALYEQIRRGEAAMPFVRRAPPARLPLQPTSFIGRVAERAELADRLTTLPCRLVTLVGPPGIGKTRLSLELAAEVQGDFDDGVAVVALTPVREPGSVVMLIAQALGVEETVEQSVLDSLTRYLRDRRVLLLLDNFEHVLEAAPVVAQLLQGAPQLTILVTSRAPLHISAEHQYLVPPLALPDVTPPPHSGSELATSVTASEAVRLFVERAQAVRMDFALTSEQAATVGKICHHLDGLPLAIELAAARIKFVAPQRLLADLSNRLSVLTDGMRDWDPRQQTLRSAIAWSYDLLDPEEQAVFRRLGVFVGGMTWVAAQAVCNPGGQNVRGGVQSLLDNSLLQHATAADGESRLAMLETLREYALEQLELSGETEATRRQHAHFFLRLAEEAEPEFRGGRCQALWVERLVTEHDNLRAALRWFLASGDLDGALGLGAALSRFWVVQTHVTEGREWLERALARSETATPLMRAKGLGAAGFVMMNQDKVAARRVLEESLALFRTLGNQLGVAEALRHLGGIMVERGEFGVARRHLEESLAIHQSEGNRWGVAWSLLYLADLLELQEDLALARSHIEDGLALFRSLGDERGQAWSLLYLGDLLQLQDDHAMARSHFEAGLTLFRGLGDRMGLESSLRWVGQVACVQGDYARAGRVFKECLALTQDRGSNGRASCLEGLAEVASAGHRLTRALVQAERAARLGGAAAALRDAIHVPLPLGARTGYERALSAARVCLGEERWAAAWSEGRTMTLEQAVAYALGDS